jgi:hypothetical protein
VNNEDVVTLVGGIFNADRLRHAVEFLISAHVDNWLTVKYWENERTLFITRFEVGSWYVNVHTTPHGGNDAGVTSSVREFVAEVRGWRAG